MKQIPLYDKHRSIVAHAVVDDADYDRLSVRIWHMSRTKGYAIHDYYVKLNNGLHSWRGGRKMVSLLLHREVMGNPTGQIVAFRGNDKLDCRKENLRVISPAMLSATKRPWGKSGYKGVVQHQITGKWEATITTGGKTIALGCYETVEEGARAYDRMAHATYGEFARLNFPNEDPTKHKIEIGRKLKIMLPGMTVRQRPESVKLRQRLQELYTMGKSGDEIADSLNQEGFIPHHADKYRSSNVLYMLRRHFGSRRSQQPRTTLPPLKANASSRFRWVIFDKSRGGRWRVIIRAKGQQHHGGLFDTEMAAAQAADNLARQVYGDRCLPYLNLQ